MKFSEHISSSRVITLLVGDSGAGKTALLASLANAGYNVRILDYDAGLDILRSFLDPDAIDNVTFETLTDTEDSLEAYIKGSNLIFKGWTKKNGAHEDLGHIKEWTDKDVLVIDSLTFLSEAAKKVALQKAGKKPTDNLSQSDWGYAQRLVTNIISYVTSGAIPCNVVITSHLAYIEEGATGINKAYPAACGKSLCSMIGRYFNNVWRVDTKVVQGKSSVSIRTVSDTKMALKNTAPSVVEPNEDADLAAIFEKIRSNAK